MDQTGQTINTGRQVTTNYDLSKIFIWNNRYRNETLVNSQYDPWNLKAGTLLGRIIGTGTVVPHNSKATDGSQDPVGILAADVIVQDGTSATVPMCTDGDVAEEQVVLNLADTLSTVVLTNSDHRSIRDLIQKNTKINLVSGTEMTAFDN